MKGELLTLIARTKVFFERGKTYILYVQMFIMVLGALKILGFSTPILLLIAFGLFVLTGVAGWVDYKIGLYGLEMKTATTFNYYFAELNDKIDNLERLIRENGKKL